MPIISLSPQLIYAIIKLSAVIEFLINIQVPLLLFIFIIIIPQQAQAQSN